jgi:uncharacterized protein (DUF433 family)
MITVNDHLYIAKDDSILNGEPIIRGTRTPVRAIVELYRIGNQPEEIAHHLPHLKLSQIFGALSYYSDHIDEINEYIRKNKVEDDAALPLDE